MNASDRSKNVQEYYTSLAAARERNLSDDFNALVNRWLAGPVGTQPPGNLSYLAVRYTDCELVALATGVTERVVSSATEKCSDLGYTTETLTAGGVSYFHVYDSDSLNYMLDEYSNYALFSV